MDARLDSWIARSRMGGKSVFYIATDSLPRYLATFKILSNRIANYKIVFLE
jgi:hypothetical protein